jgi:hypothetical protein
LAESTRTIQLLHYLRYEKNKNKKSSKFAALQEHESATFHLGFKRGFVLNFKLVRSNVEFSAERTWTIQLLHYLRYEKK